MIWQFQDGSKFYAVWLLAEHLPGFVVTYSSPRLVTNQGKKI